MRLARPALSAVTLLGLWIAGCSNLPMASSDGGLTGVDEGESVQQVQRGVAHLDERQGHLGAAPEMDAAMPAEHPEHVELTAASMAVETTVAMPVHTTEDIELFAEVVPPGDVLPKDLPLPVSPGLEDELPLPVNTAPVVPAVLVAPVSPAVNGRPSPEPVEPVEPVGMASVHWSNPGAIPGASSGTNPAPAERRAVPVPAFPTRWRRLEPIATGIATGATPQITVSQLPR